MPETGAAAQLKKVTVGNSATAVERTIGAESSWRVSPAGKHRYRVESLSSGRIYTVYLLEGAPGEAAGNCDCSDFNFVRVDKDRICPHLAAVYFYLNKGV